MGRKPTTNKRKDETRHDQKTKKVSEQFKSP